MGNMFIPKWIKISKATSGSLYFPNRCTCCLKETDFFEPVGDIKENLFTGEALDFSLDVPLCGECVNHRWRRYVYIMWMIGIPIVSAIIYVLLKSLIGNKIISGLIIFPIAIILLIILAKWRAQYSKSLIDSGHVSLKDTVAVRYKKRNDIAMFTFANEEYTRMFIEANKDRILNLERAKKSYKEKKK